jgi:hypothetical protein
MTTPGNHEKLSHLVVSATRLEPPNAQAGKTIIRVTWTRRSIVHGLTETLEPNSSETIGQIIDRLMHHAVRLWSQV